MNRLTFLLALSLAWPAFARSKSVAGTAGTGAPWSPMQATGAPDVPRAGDDGRAFATLAADSGEEWLELSFETAVTIAQVNVHETFNPGAVSKVVARQDGRDVTLWEGTAEVRGAMNVLRIKAGDSVKSKTVRVYLDTNRVPGWNEVDAVELVGLDGTKQWATSATASSSYASQTGGYGGTLASAFGKTVKVTSGGKTIEAKLVRREGDFLVFESRGKTILIAVASVQALEL